jgi:glutamyl-tRNA reductase
MKLFCIGLSHHTADVQTREQFIGRAAAENALRACGCAEALLLTTCNRVEVYGSAEQPIETAEIARCLARKIDIEPDAATFYRYEDADCALHLFRVASGLDSMVVGETEIFGQAKKAYESARASGSAGRYLHRLFQRAFRVAKQVRTHTEITRGAVSVASVAVDVAEKIFGDLRNCKLLVLGAGDTSERTVRALISRGSKDVRISNRSLDRAEELARVVGGRAVCFEEWLEQCREVDILMTSAASEAPLVTREALALIVAQRPDRPLFIIDIAVPRNVEAAVNELAGVYFYDIDSLQSVAQQSLAQRRQHIAAAEEIIAGHVAEFGAQIASGLSWHLRSADHPPIGDRALRTSEL